MHSYCQLAALQDVPSQRCPLRQVEQEDKCIGADAYSRCPRFPSMKSDLVIAGRGMLGPIHRQNGCDKAETDGGANHPYDFGL
jgi:hypothetical protein